MEEQKQANEGVMDDQVKSHGELPPDWRQMSAKDLGELCRQARLPVKGRREELIKRLDVHYNGSSSRHVNGRVACRYCGSPAVVTGTRRETDTTVRRTYRCSGRRRHTFSIVQRA